MADEMMHMMSLVLRHRFLRHQATLLMVEHRRRRKRRARRHDPYFAEVLFLFFFVLGMFVCLFFKCLVSKGSKQLNHT